MIESTVYSFSTVNEERGREKEKKDTNDNCVDNH